MTRHALLVPVIALALLAPAPGSGAVSYDTALRQGRFYLSRGPAYGPDALSSLLKAQEADPGRAASDPRWLRAAARAYALTSRYTRAFRLLERLEALGALDPGSELLREQILTETGLGRLVLESALPVDLSRPSIRPLTGSPPDSSSRKILERLSELLQEGVRIGPRPLVLLVPEGRFSFDPGPDAPLHAPAGPVDLEVWAGDEVRLRLVARYPEPGRWRVRPESRSIRLAWPPVEGFRYRLFRLQDAGPVRVYEGTQPEFRDDGLPVGSAVAYRLEVLDGRGQVVAVGRVDATTLQPVGRIAVRAELLDDLRVRVGWSLDAGAFDQVRVYRGTAGQSTEITRSDRPEGTALDGPFAPARRGQTVTYVVEAWIRDEPRPCASSSVSVEIPPRVQEVVDVSHAVEDGTVIVFWSTVPRDAVAEGYRIYRRAGNGLAAELVGEVRSAWAREFTYETSLDEDALSAEHLVVPYVGNTMILGPNAVRATGLRPEKDFKRRMKAGRSLPDLALSWNPHADAQVYAVSVGEREVLVPHPYVELDGLQTALFATRHPIRVYAVTQTGDRVLLVQMQVAYEHYPVATPTRGERP